MITGKIDKAIIMKLYDEDGEFLGEKAKYIYKPVLLWRDIIFGLILAFLIFTQLI